MKEKCQTTYQKSTKTKKKVMVGNMYFKLVPLSILIMLSASCVTFSQVSKQGTDIYRESSSTKFLQDTLIDKLQGSWLLIGMDNDSFLVQDSLLTWYLRGEVKKYLIRGGAMSSSNGNSITSLLLFNAKRNWKEHDGGSVPSDEVLMYSVVSINSDTLVLEDLYDLQLDLNNQKKYMKVE